MMLFLVHLLASPKKETIPGSQHPKNNGEEGQAVLFQMPCELMLVACDSPLAHQ